MRSSWPLRRQHVPRFALAAALVLLCAVSFVLVAPAGPAVAGVSPGVTQRISVLDNGNQYPPDTNSPFGAASDDAVSGDGRYAAFSSTQELVPPPATRAFNSDVYVRDLKNPQHTVLISRGLQPIPSTDAVRAGTVDTSTPPAPAFPTDGPSSNPSLSQNGRYVAFESFASNIPDGDSTQNTPQNEGGADQADIVICDRDPNNTGTFDQSFSYIFVGRVDEDDNGNRLFSNVSPTISADGTTISWEQDPSFTDDPTVSVVAHLAKDPVTGDLTAPDVSTYVDVRSSDSQHPDAGSFEPRLSADGLHVVFLATCPTCAEEQGLEFVPTILDIEDLGTSRTTRLDVDAGGKPLPGNPVLPTVSGNGQVVAWEQQNADESKPSQVMAVTPGSPNTETLVSQDASGATGEGQDPRLSTDGRYVAFDTIGANMSNGLDTTASVSQEFSSTPGQTRLVRQVVVRDLVVDASRAASKQPRLPAELASPSVNATCQPTVPPGATCGADQDSLTPALDDDGGVVVFVSNADDLVPGDTNSEEDAFARQFQPTVTADPVTFGTVTLGGSATQTATVHEVGFGPVRISTVTITGPNGGDFTIFPTQNCAGATLHEADTCVVGVRFTPSVVGTRTGGLTITPADGVPPVVVPISGGGGAVPVSGFAVGPNPLNFPGPQLALHHSGPQVVTVTDTGNGALTITTVTLLNGPGLFPGDYTITIDNCANTTLQPGGTCVVAITNTPHGSGSRPGALEFGDNAGNSPQLVGLNATGVTPSLRVSPTVVVAGRVTTVTGQGWPAGKPVTLTIPQLPGADTMSPPPTADANGKFSATLVIFSHAAVGTWQINGTVSGTTLHANVPLLVVLGTYQPPNFTSREGD